jgi:hypothetical protein
MNPLQEKIRALLIPADRQLTDANDPPYMERLMTGLRALKWTDGDGVPLCDELLAVALRRSFFDRYRAVDLLWGAKDLKPNKPPYASTPRQAELVFEVQRPIDEIFIPPSPKIVGRQVKALRKLGLRDRNGRRFCTQLLAAALGCQEYDVHQAAEVLLFLAGYEDHQVARPPLTGDKQNIDRLRCIHQQLSWSTVAYAWDCSQGDWDKALDVLADVQEGGGI